MPSSRQRVGGLAEDQAVLFLQRRGFVILGRHVTSRYGEIDILARDGETIVAVEVKARRGRSFGRAAESVTEKKLERIEAALFDALPRLGQSAEQIRIDIVTIENGKLDHLIGVGHES